MNASVFILPTSGPRTYRGKYPARPRSVSHGTTGLHVELNDGTRLWAAKAAELPKLADDCSAMLARAVPMTAEQYETLKAAAERKGWAPGAWGPRHIRVGHFTLDRIDSTGDFVAGCHSIKWPEVSRLAERLGVAGCLVPAADAAAELAGESV